MLKKMEQRKNIQLVVIEFDMSTTIKLYIAQENYN